MNLFPFDTTENLLPYDGKLNDYGIILDKPTADNLLNLFTTTLPLNNDHVIIHGKRHTTARKVAWFGDTQYAYYYSGINRLSQPWTKELAKLRDHIQIITHQTYNSCLVNLYHNGNEGMGWHSDNEPTLGKEPVIASLSFGATRRFLIRHNTRKITREISLHHGQLILMQGDMQQHWQHSIAKEVNITQPRLNLTFRYFIPIDS